MFVAPVPSNDVRTSVTNSWNSGWSAVRVRECRMTNSLVPSRCGKLWNIMSAACLDSGLDVMSWSVESAEPSSAPIATIDASSTTSQVAIMRHGWAAETRAKRCVTDTTAISLTGAAPSADDCNVIRFTPAVHGHTG